MSRRTRSSWLDVERIRFMIMTYLIFSLKENKSRHGLTPTRIPKFMSFMCLIVLLKHYIPPAPNIEVLHHHLEKMFSLVRNRCSNTPSKTAWLEVIVEPILSHHDMAMLPTSSQVQFEL